MFTHAKRDHLHLGLNHATMKNHMKISCLSHCLQIFLWMGTFLRKKCQPWVKSQIATITQDLILIQGLIPIPDPDHILITSIQSLVKSS